MINVKINIFVSREFICTSIYNRINSRFVLIQNSARVYLNYEILCNFTYAWLVVTYSHMIKSSSQKDKCDLRAHLPHRV